MFRLLLHFDFLFCEVLILIYKKIHLTVDGKETEAELTCYIKEQIEGREDALRKAVVICPGGGYAYVSDREADPVAMQFLAMDVQVFILNYSVAPHIFPESLLQLAAAVAYVRDHAAGWYIDPDEIGVLILCRRPSGCLARCILES